MQEYNYFKQTGTPEIHAAIAGISKEEWVFAEPQETRLDAFLKMMDNGFDILPKVNRDGTINTYFYTSEWGKYSESDIKWSKIKQEDCLYYLTHIKDIIRLMSENSRNFYFLTNHSDIIGLITISNLNCKQVAIYYYNLLCSLERSLGHFIRKRLTPTEILDSLEKLGNEIDIPSALDTVKRYKHDASIGTDASIIEYLYLSDVFLLISRHKLYKDLGYKNQEGFEKGSGKLRELRNMIAHPNKSLVKGPQTLPDLWKSSMKIEELEERLRLLYEI